MCAAESSSRSEASNRNDSAWQDDQRPRQPVTALIVKRPALGSRAKWARPHELKAYAFSHQGQNDRVSWCAHAPPIARM